MKTRYRQMIVAGPATDTQVQLLRQFARRHGLTMMDGAGLLRPGIMLKLRSGGGPVQESTWTQEALEKILLPEAMGLSEDGLEWCKPFLVDSGVYTAADLARMDFETFLQPQFGVQRHTPAVTRVIEFMMARGIAFRDLNPVQVFQTVIEEDNEFLDTRTYNCLMREGLKWVEILTFFSALGLQDMRNFGEKSLDRINALLDHHDLCLQLEVGQ